jgi:hypothetical protein
MIIQPPTDNLYKFMAIFGLILWVGGMFYPLTKAYELKRDQIELEAQVAQAEKNPEQANTVVLRKNLNQIRLALKASLAYFIIGGISMVIGGCLMYFGFKWWYVRVQKPLDAQLSLASSRPTMPSTGSTNEACQ